MPSGWVARQGDTFNPNRPYGIVKLCSREECEAADGDDSAYGSRSWIVAEVCGAGTQAETEKNAYRIAAAPELFEALESLLDAISGLEDERCLIGRDAEEKAQRALAKARGQEVK